VAHVVLLGRDLAGDERELVLLLLLGVRVERLERAAEHVVVVVRVRGRAVRVVHELLHRRVLIAVVRGAVAEPDLRHLVVDRDLPGCPLVSRRGREGGSALGVGVDGHLADHRVRDRGLLVDGRRRGEARVQVPDVVVVELNLVSDVKEGHDAGGGVVVVMEMVEMVV
jgi:hypothetical protein